MREMKRQKRTEFASGFTMIELLVVIVVLALLMALVSVVAGRAITQQKARNTQQIMQNVSLAIEEFATEDPLRGIYDRKDAASFGKYPPYQLRDSGPGSVSRNLESLREKPGGANGTLRQRMRRDMLGETNPSDTYDEKLSLAGPGEAARGNDDNRALYGYLAVYTPSALSLVPEANRKPLGLLPGATFAEGEYVNTSTATIGTPQEAGSRTPILGFYDAWGVPLDYMLYVKCEYRLPPGGSTPQWVVTERKPVLRSRGIDADTYKTWVQSNDDPTRRTTEFSPPDKWIFSEELPKPWAGLTDDPAYRDGMLPSNPNPPAASNGWVRAVGLDEDYAYRPDGDAEPP